MTLPYLVIKEKFETIFSVSDGYWGIVLSKCELFWMGETLFWVGGGQ